MSQKQNLHNNRTFLSPAKINLFLHILARRDDGYHDLQTAFQFLDYCDKLSFSINNSGDILRVDDGTKYDNDLILQAANLLQKESRVKLGADIHLQKIIPEGGGLGGGSSNAATTMLALNSLWSINFEIDKLCDLGLQLGADVPVFIRGFAAMAEGVGEILTPIYPSELWYLVIDTGEKVSTKRIFNAKELTRNSSRLKIPNLDDGRNDCIEVVIKLFPQIKQALSWLNNYAKAKLTGTGACVFARFDDQNSAQNVLQKLPDKWQGFIAKGVNKSPLYQDF